jgi:hypothetical protein
MTASNVSSIGKTISQFTIAAENDTTGTQIARIKNICITDGLGNGVYNTQNFAGMF